MQQASKSLITSVEKGKHKNRYHIYLDEDYAFTVDEEVLVRHKLFKGTWLDAKHVQEVLEDEQREKAMAQIIRWIAIRPRSQLEVEQGLRKKNFEQPIIDQVIEICKQKAYLDDLTFARHLANHRTNIQKKGKHWIEQELLAKGIDRVHIEQVFREREEQDDEGISELELAKQWVNKKWGTLKGEPYQKKQKMAAFLARKGFDHEIIRQSMSLEEDY